MIGKISGSHLTHVFYGCVAVVVLLGLSACGMVKPMGLVYTNIRLPLTTNLENTPVSKGDPPAGRVLEIREPFSGFGVYAKVDDNAVGDIASKHGMQVLFFADKQVFSILGIWSTNKTILYGK
jgi:hypothetical protein